MVSLKSLMSLENRVAIITGGAGHICAHIAHALAELGGRIAVVDLSASAAAAVASEIEKRHHVEAKGYGVDMGDEKAVRACPHQIAKDFGRLDIIVNGAAFGGTTKLTGWVTDFEQQSIDTWRSAMEVNLTAPVVMVQEAAPLLRASGHGSVINVSSIYGFLGPDMRLYEDTPMGNPAAYAASKGGLIQITRWLSTVLAPEIRVNCLSPGGVWRSQPDSFVKRYISRTPLKRMGREDDFMGAAAFLASDLSSYVTGQHLVIDGGFSVW